MFETNFLLASLLWGTIGTGCVIYGKKQAAPVPLVVGLALIALSTFVPSALLLSVLSVLLLAGMVWAHKRGF